MRFHPSISNLAAAPLMLALVVLGTGRGVAQTAEALELREAQLALQLSGQRISDLEARLEKAKTQVNALSESLASANGDTRQTREEYEKLRVQMEGLGMALLDPSSGELQQRLLAALSDLRLVDAQKRQLEEALLVLSEKSIAFAKAAGQVAESPRQDLEQGLAKAEQALSSARKIEDATPQVDLQNARVVSLKEDLGIAVLNVGSKHGVHPGMPFSVYRADKPIARALAVDVRGSICGVVIQDLVAKDEPVKVGDTGKVEAIKG